MQLRAALGIVQYNSITSLLQVNGKDIIYIKPKLYALDAIPYPWDVTVGTRIFVDASCLSGYGATLRPIELITDGEVWLPYGEQILYSAYGSYASPVGTDTQPATPAERTFFGANSWHKIPYQLMYAGLGVRVRCTGFKTGADATSTQFRLRLGQTSSGASGDIIAIPATAATQLHEITGDTVARINVLGGLTTAQFTTIGVSKLFTTNTPTLDSAADRKTGFSTTQDNFVTLSTSTAAAGAVANILNFSISLVP